VSRLGRLIPLLLLLVAFLGWETWLAWIEPPARDPSAAPGAQASPAAAGDNAAGQPAAGELAAAVSAITSRPLLRPDRQPFKEVPLSATVPQRNYEAELARFSVVGILPIDGREKALVVRKAPGQAGERWEVAPGDPLPGFVVKSLRPDGVLLSADGRELLLPMIAGGPRSGGEPVRTEVSAPAGSAPTAHQGGQPPGAPRGILPSAGQPIAQPPGVPGYAPPQPVPGQPVIGGNVRYRARVLPPRSSTPPAVAP
jgi:hypothetical protein